MTGTTTEGDEIPRSDDYLGDLETAWQGCREAVEATQERHRARRVSVTARHHEALDRAWAEYQRVVAKPSAPPRRDTVAAARRTFNAAAAEASRSREAALAAAAEEYVAALERVCDRYEGAVDVAVSAAASAMAGGLSEHPRGSLAAV